MTLAISSPPALDLSAQTGFAGNPLDRLSELRGNAEALAALRDEPGAHAVIIARERILMRAGDASPFFALAEALALADEKMLTEALLGRDARGPVFAFLLDDTALVETAAEPAQSSDWHFPGRDDLVPHDLRALGMEGLVGAIDLAILSQAKSVLFWHRRHRFCPNCGAPTKSASAGWRRECASCGAQHFPRTDPVVIMMAVDGDACLLGRQPQFPPGFYSCLAGFLESGETVEDAVRREIAEEAGIRIGRVSYLGSQPWPFPSSLMIGCRAEAVSREIAIDGQELEHARWFSRAEVATMLAKTHPEGLFCPAPLAIAYHLIKAWVEEHHVEEKVL
jgi:NAD+ diphosphatase